MNFEIPDYISFTAGESLGQGIVLDQRSYEVIKLNRAGEVAWESVAKGSLEAAVEHYSKTTSRDHSRSREEILSFAERLVHQGIIFKQNG